VTLLESDRGGPCATLSLGRSLRAVRSVTANWNGPNWYVCCGGGDRAGFLSPRQHGKSSLALATLTGLRSEGLLTAYVDVMLVLSGRVSGTTLMRDSAGSGWEAHAVGANVGDD
jgi:hypothetical protein